MQWNPPEVQVNAIACSIQDLHCWQPSKRFMKISSCSCVSCSHVSMDTSVKLKVMPTYPLNPSLDISGAAMAPQPMCSCAVCCLGSHQGVFDPPNFSEYLRLCVHSWIVTWCGFLVQTHSVSGLEGFEGSVQWCWLWSLDVQIRLALCLFHSIQSCSIPTPQVKIECPF